MRIGPHWCAPLRWLLALGSVLLLIGAMPPGAAAQTAADLATGAGGVAASAPPGVAVDALANQPPAQLVVMNRRVATLRDRLFGIPAEQRVAAAELRIEQALHARGPLKVATQVRSEGVLVSIDGVSMFAITPGDVPGGTPQAALAEARNAAARLQQVVDESREARDLGALLRGAAVAAGVSVLALGLLWLLRRLRRRVGGWVLRHTLEHADRLRVGGVEVLQRERLLRLERAALNTVFWALVLLLLYEWLSLVLAQFPYTRPWADRLNDFLLGLIARFALAIVHAIPDLLAAALIFWLAWLLTRLLRRFFGQVADGRIQLAWLGADVAATTSKLCVGVIWLFALAMAYPYLPGSGTEAFRGLSVLVGLMISLGASNLVGQLASGLILTYTRTLRVGEFVRVGEHEGTVVGLGAFTTRIRTGMGAELTISNSQVIGAVTQNYSRAVKGVGFIVDTTVTIGYDAPWRQVSAMLVEAARRTPGVLADPPPQVFQIALSDFYPEYRLVCQAVPAQPRPRAEVMDMLHANVQDVFNEHGVQIMSPHYLGDPAAPKVIARAHWYAPPARPPDGELPGDAPPGSPPPPPR